MAKYTKDMSASQRIRYNRYHRFLYLINQLELWKQGKRAHPPHPTKPDPGLLKLYKRYGADHLVVIPMSWMDKAQVKKVRNREKYQRSKQWK